MYTYDTQGQLTGANIPTDDLSYLYSYDNAGNILQVRASGMTAGHTSDNYTNRYAYENESWPDLLTAFNEQNIAYEGQTFNPSTGTVSGTVKSGNPISYFNGTRWTFSWENGRQLATASSSEGNTDITIDYAYDLNGYRTSKTMVTKTYETVPVHNYVTTVVAPTCTEGGYTLHRCACGESYRTDETAALGHNYVRNTSNTVISYTCTRCGDTYTDHTHSYTTTVVEPTCTEDGYTLHECACGYSYRDAEVRALGHSFVKISQSGNTATFRCTRCGYTHTSEAIPVPTDPKPPIVSYSLGEDEATTTSTTGCGSERVLKTTVTEEHSYIYAGGRLLRETITTTAANGTVSTKVLDFSYDAQGIPYSLTCTNGTASPETYYYITNLQGDVTYLINSSGVRVATYEYDPYGKITYTTGSMAQINPLRYRGYYYDSDTEFYYLQSRYYDAAICRFINADSYSSTGQGILGCNMFAYCRNSPIFNEDPTGDLDWGCLIKGAGRLVTGITAVVVGAAVCIAGAPVTMIVAAGVTIAAGALTVANGSADIQQAATGNNYIRDSVFNGNQSAYNVYSGAVETVAVIGTAVCGNYLRNTCTMKGATPGSEGKTTLQPGQQLDRYGSEYGRYLTDPGTSADQLALTPGNTGKLTSYVVNKPFTVSTGTVAACEWGAGGGVQYFT